jgi:carbonic anhydrase
MALLDDILQFNRKFVEERRFESYQTSKFPDKKMVIFTCMDTRLVELLPKAMNLRNGDVKIVKNAGATLTHPFDSTMRSILVAVYELGAEEVAVIGHHRCGMAGLNPEVTIGKMKERGVAEEVLDTLKHSGLSVAQWLEGFQSVEENVRNSVETICRHPLLPEGVPVHGLVIDPDTGKLDLVVRGQA